MIQNISQKRASTATTSVERKRQLRITLNDTARIGQLASLSIYHGLTQRQPCPLNHHLGVFVYYVKNNKDGAATCKWKNYWYSSYGNSSYCTTSGQADSIVNYRSNAAPSEIHPNLKFDSEEAKIIIEVSLCAHNGRPKKAFGLYLVNLRGRREAYFQSVVIFTPKKGLFYESVIKSSYASETDEQVNSW